MYVAAVAQLGTWMKEPVSELQIVAADFASHL